MPRFSLGTIPNVKGRQRETPYGKSPLGDAIWWARTVGEFGSQEALANSAGIGRIDVLKLEKGASKGNSHQVMTSLSRAFGQPHHHFDAYISGGYGPPSEKAARRFLAGEPPPATEEAPARVSGVVAQALFNLSYKLSPARFLVVRDIAAGLAFDGSEDSSPDAVERVLLGLEAEAKNKSVPNRSADLEDTETGIRAAASAKPKKGKAK